MMPYKGVFRKRDISERKSTGYGVFRTDIPGCQEGKV